MTPEQTQVAENLLAQLNEMKAHGFKVLALIGAEKFVALDDDGGLQFTVHPGGKNKGKFNKIVIKYDYGSDLYNMELWMINIKKFKMDVIYSIAGIDVEQLYETVVTHVVDGHPLPKAEAQ